MEGQRLEELQLPQMLQNNEDAKCTAFTVSTDYRHGTSTGISASDRAATIRGSPRIPNLARPTPLTHLRPTLLAPHSLLTYVSLRVGIPLTPAH
jgi:hypothetical protein